MNRNQFKGTKGKWEYEGGDNHSIDIILPNDTTISVDRQSRYTGEYVVSREEMQYNALLISKAPEMLKMLQDIHTGRKEGRLNAYVTLNEINELIKSATTLKEGK